MNVVNNVRWINQEVIVAQNAVVIYYFIVMLFTILLVFASPFIVIGCWNIPDRDIQ